MAKLIAAPIDLANSAGITSFNYQGRIGDFWDGASGLWHEIVASASEDWVGFYVEVGGSDDGYIRVAKGASGSEVVVGAGMHKGGLSRTSISYFPIAVAAGTRVAASYVSGGNNGTLQNFQIIGVPASEMPNAVSFANMDIGPINMDGANSGEYAQGVTLIDAVANNTKSAWTELSVSGVNSTPNNRLNGNSLSYAYDYLGLWIDKVNYGQADAVQVIDLAYGPAENEVPFIENFALTGRGTNLLTTLSYTNMFFPWGRPAGDRISARYQVSDIATEGPPRIMLIGLRN